MEIKLNYAIHPGKFIERHLKALEMTQKELSIMSGLQTTIVNELIKGKRNINAEIALRLEIALGSSSRYWTNLQSLYDEVKARAKLEESEDISTISVNCSYEWAEDIESIFVYEVENIRPVFHNSFSAYSADTYTDCDNKNLPKAG